ncbi:hypothetical protein DL96DRAFT_145086 [Flagelloscypha sp. PMI_526]|nr:hypothetical protein DL96DRAFT_145086 [Flagelloscypha sp. PMI_526]
MTTSLYQPPTTDAAPLCFTMPPSAPIDIPAKRGDSGCVTYSPCEHFSSTGSDLLFEMDPTFDTPAAPVCIHDEPCLYTFPNLRAIHPTVLNNGQSKAPTPYLSPSSSCSSTSDMSDIFHHVEDTSRSRTRKPLASRQNAPALVVCAAPATKISGFTPSLTSSAASSYRGDGGKSSISTVMPPSRFNAHRRHHTLFGHPTWHHPTSASLNSENLKTHDEYPELDSIERISRFHRKRNVSSDARF